MKLAIRAVFLVTLAALLPAGSCHWAFTSGSGDPPPDGGAIIIVESATFGGWTPTEVGSLPGVLSVTRGWSGRAMPFFGAMLAGWTGHSHATRIRFDATQISYAELVAAVRAERIGRLTVTVYPHSAGQKQDALAQFPADTLPRLRLRESGKFVAR